MKCSAALVRAIFREQNINYTFSSDGDNVNNSRHSKVLTGFRKVW